MITIYGKVDKKRHKINKFKMSVGECDSSLRTFEDLGTEVIPNVTLDNISKIHFIPRKFIPKSKITFDHARKFLVPGEDGSAETKLEELNQTKKDAKEWFRNEVSKIVTVQIHLYRLTYKILLNCFHENVPVTSIDTFLLKV